MFSILLCQDIIVNDDQFSLLKIMEICYSRTCAAVRKSVPDKICAAFVTVYGIRKIAALRPFARRIYGRPFFVLFGIIRKGATDHVVAKAAL